MESLPATLRVGVAAQLSVFRPAAWQKSERVTRHPRMGPHRANATSPQRLAHRIPYNDSAAHRAIQRPRIASRTTTAHRISYNDRAAHRANGTSP
jgi:hypothetical protein